MNFRVVSKVLGMLLCLIGIAMGACAAYSRIKILFFDDDVTLHESAAFDALWISTAITIGCGLLMLLCGRHGGKEILRREAIVIVALGWILTGLFGAIPFVLCEPGLDVIPAIFESVSGFTTTGSTVMSDIEAFPLSILLWRSLTQWLGGIGILVLFAAVLSFLGVGSRSLMQQESSLNISDANKSRIRDVAIILLKIYLTLTALCTISLMCVGMNGYESFLHAMATIATGGFSPKNASIGHYDSIPIEATVSVFMVLGSLSFMLYVFILRRNWQRLKTEEEAKFYLIMLVIACVAIAVDVAIVSDHKSMSQAFHESFFNVISLSSTTGFGVSDYDEWPLFSRMMLIFLMIIGGCAGSTAGGVKMNRVILFQKIARTELKRTFRPHQVFRITLNGAAPDKKVFVTTTLFLALSFVVVLVASLLVALFQPNLDLISVFGCVYGTLFNIGPGFEAVGPTDNFGFLNDQTLVLLSLLMIIGRLEFFAILALFMPSLWRRY